MARNRQGRAGGRLARGFCFLLLALSPLPAAAQAPAQAPADAEWRAFSRRYVAPGGRIIDTANQGISHSEGQGYGMFFAVYFNDRAAFERIWGWTQRTLSRRQDALFSWRYDPRSSFPVSDPNNATDGDIFIAWALLMASERWDVPDYRAAAARVATAILNCCTVEVGNRLVLLPGISGFQRAEGIVVNLSYYAFPALRALSRVVPDRRWARLERDGLELIREAAFGQPQLPPDWLLLGRSDERPAIAPGWPPRFSWDAVRVPLNLAWQRVDAPTLSAANRFWANPENPHRPPAWIDLRSGQMPPYAGHAGTRAVHALTRARLGEASGRPLRVADAPDYFGAALVLQARIAETMPPEPPALEPPEASPPPPQNRWFTELGRAVLTRIRREDREDPNPVTEARWSRPDFLEPSQVRGVPSGLRGLVPPR
ncbi:glycosyl hydrolase family 8 [Roseococcus pinisoli]|uniref:Glucanase n=1 Tax=Roseococcus pinisoli TaxID=2835040 RepID=A0ABS5Q8W6_9PROT|nr:glycosyl hydrolase family 8 [Roseococcus pinisoli]MBS7809934.1 hypothetical protein [Roseococcus pinisoli]